MEDAIYDSQAIRRFIGIDLNVDTAPEATTLLKFRRLLETHSLTKVVFDTINCHLAAKGLLLKERTIVGCVTLSVARQSGNGFRQRHLMPDGIVLPMRKTGPQMTCLRP